MKSAFIAFTTSAFLLGGIAVTSASDCCARDTEVSKDKKNNATAEHSDSANALFDKYEALSEALVADDLSETRSAAEALVSVAEEKGEERTARFAKETAQASDLAQARETLVPLSREIIMLGAEKEDLFVMNCPMVENGNWLQSSEETSNPYMGQRMPRCGGMVMQAAEIELAACCDARRACCDDGGECCPV